MTTDPDIAASLATATDDLFTRRQTSEAVAEEVTGAVTVVQVSDVQLASATGIDLGTVRAWLDEKDGDTLAVSSQGETRVVVAILKEPLRLARVAC